MFNPEYPIDLYLLCPQVMKRVEQILRSSTLDQKDRTNVRFHIGMVAAALAAGVASPGPTQVARLRADAFTSPLLRDAFEIVTERYKTLGGTDQVSKGPELVADLKTHLVDRLHRAESVAAQPG